MLFSDPVLVTEAARILEVSEDTVRRLAATGVLPVQRTSTGVRVFRRDDVLRIAEQRARRGRRRGLVRLLRRAARAGRTSRTRGAPGRPADHEILGRKVRGIKPDDSAKAEAWRDQAGARARRARPRGAAMVMSEFSTP